MQRQQDDDTVHAAAIVLAAAARATSTGLLRHQQHLDDDDHASCAAAVRYIRTSTCFRLTCVGHATCFLSEFLMHQLSFKNHINNACTGRKNILGSIVF